MASFESVPQPRLSPVINNGFSLPYMEIGATTRVMKRHWRVYRVKYTRKLQPFHYSTFNYNTTHHGTQSVCLCSINSINLSNQYSLVIGKSVCQNTIYTIPPLLILLHAGEKKADDKDEKEIKGVHVIMWIWWFPDILPSSWWERYPNLEDLRAL